MGALTKRPLFILFCQQPKRRGECPQNAIIQSTPLRNIHASHSRKLTISVLANTEPLLASLSLSRSHFRPSSFVLFLFLFYSLFPLRSIAKPPPPNMNISTGRAACSFFADIPFLIACSRRDPVPVARINSIKRDEYESAKRSACEMWCAFSIHCDSGDEMNEHA